MPQNQIPPLAQSLAFPLAQSLAFPFFTGDQAHDGLSASFIGQRFYTRAPGAGAVFYANPQSQWMWSSGAKVERAASGLLTDYSANAPAFAWDASLAALGVRLEGMATEFLNNVEDFSVAGWTKTGVTISANATASPDGTTTADKLVEDVTTSEHRVFQGWSGTNGVPYTLSVFAKPDQRSRLMLFDNNAVSHQVTFNVLAGSVQSQVTGVGRVEQFANDFDRVSVSNTAVATTADNAQFRMTLDNGGVPYLGVLNHGLFVWGANLTNLLFPSSYIRSASTRAADAVSRALGAEWSATENTVVISARTAPGIASANQVVWQVDDATANNRICVLRNTSSEIHVLVVTGGVTQADLKLGVVADDTNFSISLYAAANDFRASLNGGAVVSDTSGSLPTVTTMRLGSSTANENWFGTVAALDTYPA